MKIINIEKPILRFYLVGFIPILFVYIIFELLNVSYMNFLYFTVSYCWNYSLRSPGIRERVATLAYRFTFIKFTNNLDDLLTKPKICERNNYIKLLFRSFAPLSFICLIFILTGDGNFLFCLFGVVLFESVFEIAVRKDYI